MEELDHLISVYLSAVPKDALQRYKLAEFAGWENVLEPKLTLSSARALADGRWLPYLEPARKRIQEGRGFEVRLWDGREIDDPAGSFSLSVYGLHLRGRGVVSAAKCLFPVDFDPQVLIEVSRAIGDRVRFRSGHGGLSFAYLPRYRVVAFREIYYRARRFWCVDVEDLESTLRNGARGIKTVGWITMLGREDGSPDLVRALEAYASESRLRVARLGQGALAVIGPEPVPGDVNRVGGIPVEYFHLASILESTLVPEHPDFPNDLFADPRTMDWIRRFIEPVRWS